jgi:lipopolysaccharide biosynthesis glycosyltransferase
VLYTDCDVMFTGDPEPLIPDLRGSFLGVAPESDPEKPDDINSGVMILRLPALRVMDGAFQRFIEMNLARCAKATDQFAYQVFFRHGWKQLGPELNWKPYWGENPDARIVHFHGPKPFLRRVIEAGGGLQVHRDLARGAYARYCHLWEEALLKAG